MRRILLLATLAAVMVGCTQGASDSTDNKSPDAGKATESNTNTKPIEGKLKVALLTPGPVTDKGWSELAYKGLKDIETELGAEVQNMETKDATISDAMRSYAQKGFHLVFGHGYEYNEPGVKLSEDFPNTVFISSSGGGTSANAGAFRFYLEQGFYLAGYMAASMSKTGKLAMIGGPKVPSIESTFKAFEAGAKAAKPTVSVITAFTLSNDDVVKAKQATEKAIAEGADFVIHQANAGSKGVFDACKEKGVKALGANADQNADPSGSVVASAVVVAGPAFLDLAKRVQAGTYKGGVDLKGMQEGAVDFVVSPTFAGSIPDDLKKKLDELKADITSGKLVVPKDDF